MIYRVGQFLFKANYKPTKGTPVYPENVYLFKVNNKNTRKKKKLCSKLILRSPERRQWVVCCV